MYLYLNGNNLQKNEQFADFTPKKAASIDHFITQFLWVDLLLKKITSENLTQNKSLPKNYNNNKKKYKHKSQIISTNNFQSDFLNS